MSRKRYYRRRRYQEPSPIEMIFEMLFALIVFVSKHIFETLSHIVKKINQHEAPDRTTAIVQKQNEMYSIPLAVNNDESTKDLVEEEEFEFEEKEQKYDLKPSLLTPTEKEFYTVLKTVVNKGYEIHVQVPLSGIMKVKNSSYGYTNYHDFNRIKAKTIDFVLYDENLTPFLAIELDDYSHTQSKRIKRDNFVDDLMEEVGLRILHVPVSGYYDSEKLKLDIFISNHD